MVNRLFPFHSGCTITLSGSLILRMLSIAIVLITTQSGFSPAQAAAASNIDRTATKEIQDVTNGTLLLRTAEPGKFVPAPVLKTDIHITVTGIIARATVRQEVINPCREQDGWSEGIHIFPLPETAAVDHLRMSIGERIIEGQIKERAEAKQIYDRMEQEGKRASLIEQERPNIFTTSLANIGPGDRITFEIEYQETIRYDQGRFTLRVPIVVGPRYIPGFRSLSKTDARMPEDEAGIEGGTRETECQWQASIGCRPLLLPGNRPMANRNGIVDLCQGLTRTDPAAAGLGADHCR